MASIFNLAINQNASISYKNSHYNLTTVLWMLFARVLLFLGCQSLSFTILYLLKVPAPWEQSANWWPFYVTITNLICVICLDQLLKRENKRFLDFFTFQKGAIKDILIAIGLLVISGPIAFIPNLLLGNALFGNIQVALDLFYRPLPVWAAWTTLVIFPLTMPLGELTIYFGYVMPRLEVITGKRWLALTLPALMLSFQHFALPLLFNPNFIIWRLFMFLPFAFLVGLIIRWRPSLFPYIMIGHFFIDIMTAMMVITVSLPK